MMSTIKHINLINTFFNNFSAQRSSYYQQQQQNYVNASRPYAGTGPSAFTSNTSSGGNSVNQFYNQNQASVYTGPSQHYGQQSRGNSNGNFSQL